MPEWNTDDRGRTQENEFTTSYGEHGADADWDGKSCADFEQVPGREIGDIESVGMLTDTDAESGTDQQN